MTLTSGLTRHLILDVLDSKRNKPLTTSDDHHVYWRAGSISYPTLRLAKQTTTPGNGCLRRTLTQTRRDPEANTYSHPTIQIRLFGRYQPPIHQLKTHQRPTECTQPTEEHGSAITMGSQNKPVGPAMPHLRQPTRVPDASSRAWAPSSPCDGRGKSNERDRNPREASRPIVDEWTRPLPYRPDQIKSPGETPVPCGQPQFALAMIWTLEDGTGSDGFFWI